MRWAGHIAHMGGGEVQTGFWWGNLRERDDLEDPDADGRIILKWIFRKWDGGIDWIDITWNRAKWCILVDVVMNCLVP